MATTFLALILSIIFFLLTPASSQLTRDSLFFPGFKDATTNFTLAGASQIQGNGILRLTNDTNRVMGHAFYASPFQFKNSTDGKVASFSTTFAITIVPEYPKLGGHGMAFTISSSQHLKALPSQYLGLFNATDLLGNLSTVRSTFAVEFDTVQDFEFGDINDNHIGIDIDSLRSNASVPAAYYPDDGSFTAKDLNLKCGKPIQVWIDYDSVGNVLNVTISPTSTKPRRPILSFPVDLSPIFEENMFVGFSASTGLLASSHYILGWSFKLNGQAQGLDLSSLPSLSNSNKSHQSLTIGITVASVFTAICILSFAVAYLVRKKIRNREDQIEDWELGIGPQRYSYSELKRATHNFSEKELLGSGGFGQVYRGTIPESKIQVAVKRISDESKQGLREFVSEIGSIGKLRHRNLVQLIGWCRRKGDLLLVYEYMPNGSLDSFLFDEQKTVLNWEQRFKIIKDVASGLLYLHEGYEQVVIHRDVKASNVLLDGEMNAKLGDFGLARLYERGSNPGTTRVVGTLGYLAPEMTRTGKSTASSDVYALGALLLEVVCGRRPIDPKAAPDELVLVDVVWERLKDGKIGAIVDRRLNGDYNEKEAAVALKLGIMCSCHEAAVRPTAREVVRYLDGEIEVPESYVAPASGSGGGGSGGGGRRSGVTEGFDEYLNSIGNTTTFGFMSSTGNSFIGNGNGNGVTELGTLSTSPL